MKKLFFLFYLFFQVIQLTAQKEDNVWVFGYDSNTYPEHPGTERISFQFIDSLKIIYSQEEITFFATNATICDTSGNLLLLSNGCYVETASGAFVENSDGLNPGTMADLFCHPGDGYNIPQSTIMLRDPGAANLIHLFHARLTITSQTAFLEYLLHTVVDMNANNGSGKALFKNQIVIQDTLHYDGFHAVRHANGRDWWIVAAKYKGNTYHSLLLSPSGITSMQQDIGIPAESESGGELIFSPDGTKMARFNTKDDLRIFNFDRCTGTLSNPIFIPITDNADNEIFAGLAWSADGHYLYAAEIKRLLQFDAWAPDIAASKVVIAEASAPVCFLSGSIGYLELGPDGMIYGRPLNGQKCMHRIKHPERGGVACEFEQNYYQLEFGYVNMPHFPNFRLGPVDGSTCDTLGLNNQPLAGWRYDHTGGTGVDFISVSWYEPTAWLWDFGDGTQSSTRNPSHSFPGPGAYEVCLLVSNQYGSDTKCKTVWVKASGSNSPVGADGITFYPNPAHDAVFWTGTGSEVVFVRLFNQLGQLQQSWKTDNGFVRASGLPAGIYTVQLSSIEGALLKTQRIILQ